MLREVSAYDTHLLAEVEELENQLFDNSFNATTLARELTTGAKLWVAEGTTGLEGYMLLRSEKGLTDILRIGVRAAFQARGIGSSLLRAAKQEFGRLMLSVRKSNTRAIQLYQRHGFDITGDLGGSWVMELHGLQREGRPAAAALGDLLAVR
jgi:ribosomal protein S18 acetylase RimI-like enzyme